MKIRDLFIVAAFVLGVVACSYRVAIQKFFEPAVKPVQYYVDAPQREQELRAALAEAEELAELRAMHIAVLDEEKSRATGEVASLSKSLQVQLSTGTALRNQAGKMADELRAATDELSSLRAYRARFETLCRRIKQLDGDAHAIEQLVSE